MSERGHHNLDAFASRPASDRPLTSRPVGDDDLFPEFLFQHLSEEERDSLKRLLSGEEIEELDIDLSESP